MVSTNYKIIAFNESSGQITVQFEHIKHPFVLDLQIDEDGLYLEGDKLDSFIRGICPIGNVIRQNKITEGIPNSKNILALVETSLPTEETQTTLEPELVKEDFFRVKLVIAIQQTLAEMAGATV